MKITAQGEAEANEEQVKGIVDVVYEKSKKEVPPPGAPVDHQADKGKNNEEEDKGKEGSKTGKKPRKGKRDKENLDKQATALEVAKEWQETLLGLIKDGKEYKMRLSTVRLQSALSESLGNNVSLAETLWKRLDIHVQKKKTDTSEEYEPIVVDIIKMFQPLKDDVAQAAGVLGLKKRTSASGRKSKTNASEPEQTED